MPPSQFMRNCSPAGTQCARGSLFSSVRAKTGQSAKIAHGISGRAAPPDVAARLAMDKAVAVLIVKGREGMARRVRVRMPFEPGTVARRWAHPDGGEGARGARWYHTVPGSGSHDGFLRFDCPEPFPLYVARIDDRPLLRPTPEGVRLARNFRKILFRFLVLAENTILQNFQAS